MDDDYIIDPFEDVDKSSEQPQPSQETVQIVQQQPKRARQVQIAIPKEKAVPYMLSGVWIGGAIVVLAAFSYAFLGMKRELRNLRRIVGKLDKKVE